MDSILGGQQVEVSFPGGIATKAKSGEKLENVIKRANYNDCNFVCREGWCSACEHILDGKRVKLCQMKVPKQDSVQFEAYNWEEDEALNANNFIKE